MVIDSKTLKNSRTLRLNWHPGANRRRLRLTLLALVLTGMLWLTACATGIYDGCPAPALTGWSAVKRGSLSAEIRTLDPVKHKHVIEALGDWVSLRRQIKACEK